MRTSNGQITVPAMAAKLNDAVTRAVATPSVQETLKKLGIEPKSSTPEAFAAATQANIGKWAKVVDEADIRLD
jgi:tripartite-type tricarboxylate transporter receptor subunit TctC